MSDLTTIISLLTEIRDRLPASAIPIESSSTATVIPPTQPTLEWAAGLGGWAITLRPLNSSITWYSIDRSGYVYYWEKGVWRTQLPAASIEEAIEVIYCHADANGIVVPDHPDYPRQKKRTAVETMFHVAIRHALLPSFDGYLDADTMKIVAIASFAGVSVKAGDMLSSVFGRGEDFEKAAADYLDKIAGKLVVAYGPTGRREFIIPKENCNV